MIHKLQNHSNHFTIVSNHYLQNKQLSWSAKGLLTYLLSLPADFKVNLAYIKTVSLDGIHSTRSALRELEQHGHCKKVVKREGGFIVYQDFEIYENPQ